MLDIHLFGKYRRLAENSKATDDSVIYQPYVDGESMKQLLERIGIDPEDTGELLINFVIASFDTIIPYDECRVSIFPAGMVLLCGGSHLKGHGYATRRDVSVDYYGQPELKSKEEFLTGLEMSE